MKTILRFSICVFPSCAMAQVATGAPIDFTPIAVAVVGGVFSVIGIVATTLINSRTKDKQAADTLNNAIANSLGAIQKASDAGLKMHPLQATIPVSPTVAAGIQYVLDHAGEEAIRLGVTPTAIADKINAKLGLAEIATAPVATK